ncbi:hypothetical protein ACJX0J_016147, partial [Zea mays]
RGCGIFLMWCGVQEQQGDVETMSWIHSAMTLSGTAQMEQRAGTKVDDAVPDT